MSLMANEPKVIGIIPARLQATRFPKKVLAPILGKPMIQWVWEAASQSKKIDKLLVATDSQAVFEVVNDFGGEAVMSPSNLCSGTDRAAYVVKNLSPELIVNLQGDEPLLRAEDVDRLVEAMEQRPEMGMGTLAVSSSYSKDLADPNVVKVVCSESGEALYFSRQALSSQKSGEFLKHIGIYAFRRSVLQSFCRWKPTHLEQTERLEQLRALEKGIRIQVILVKEDSIAVDVPTDIEKVESFLSSQIGLGNGGRPSERKAPPLATERELSS